MRFTKPDILALPVPDKGVVYHSDEMRGLFVAVRAGGARSWVIRYTHGERRPYFVFADASIVTPDAARRQAAEILAGIRLGQYPDEIRKGRKNEITVAQLFDRYFSEHAPKKKIRSVLDDRINYRAHIETRFADKTLREVTRAEVAAMMADLADRPVAANRVRALLSKAFSLAERWELLPQNSNPCALVDRYREKARERLLTPDEIATLGITLEIFSSGVVGDSNAFFCEPILPYIEAAKNRTLTRSEIADAIKKLGRLQSEKPSIAPLIEKHVAKLHSDPSTIKALGPVLAALQKTVPPEAIAFFRLALFTGYRQGDIVKLQWEWIDRDSGVIRVPDSKHGGTATAHLIPEAVDVLAGLKPRESGPVFPWVRFPKNHWKTIRDASGIADQHFHDLRHVVGSYAARGGTSQRVIAKMLNHKNLGTTERYVNALDRDVAEATRKTGATISEMLQAKKNVAKKKEPEPKPEPKPEPENPLANLPAEEQARALQLLKLAGFKIG